MAPCPTKATTSKGDPHAYQQGASTKAQITPVWSFQGRIFEQHLSRSFTNFPRGSVWTLTLQVDDQDLFFTWLEQSFIPEIKRCHVPKPVMLLLCDENNIILNTHHPNSTHLLQALDLELMGLAKMTYRQEVLKWLSNNIKKSYDKLAFMEVFRIVFDKCTTIANAVKQFKKSGIFPWNPEIRQKPRPFNHVQKSESAARCQHVNKQGWP